jgi:hypothetical protein
VTPLATGIVQLAREQGKTMELGLRTFSKHLDWCLIVRCAEVVASVNTAAGAGKSKLAVKDDSVSVYG